MDHRELAADLVACEGVVLRKFLRVLDDIKVGHRGLDHDDVRAFVHIAFLHRTHVSTRSRQPALKPTHDRAAREALGRRRELVAFPVPERGRAPRGVPEGPIEPTRELGRVRHERAPVPEATVDERALDGLDTTVHHVGGRDAVRAGARIRESDLGDARGGRALVERTVGTEEATVAVRGVLAEADVARDVEVRVELAQFADG